MTAYLPHIDAADPPPWPLTGTARLLVEAEHSSHVLPPTIKSPAGEPVTCRVADAEYPGTRVGPHHDKHGSWDWSLTLPDITLHVDTGPATCTIRISGEDLPEVRHYVPAPLDAYWTGRAGLLELLAQRD
ncbi:hypothetical protein [Streptomyces sp. 8N616]|uniref:hypothetical protein n=1 Tax=Streptomyces sp. 8N616 TaxID=3457414 RepID=UPI003FD4CE64